MENKFLRKLVLENGQEFCGEGFGAKRDAICEIVFNTAMAGYQEMLSDPSCIDTMVVMTYPLIGNYGITDEDFETKTPVMGGMVVREYNDSPSNFRYTKTLSEVLEENNIPGISGMDTRKITRILRSEGSQKAMITDIETPKEDALAAIRAYAVPRDGVARVSCKKKWYSRTPNPVYNVVAVDCGIKLSIVSALNKRGCNVTVVPYDTPAQEILNLKPDGVLISNGPGSPEDALPVVELVQTLRGKLPMFGICLGHLLIAKACGAKTYKMKLGHRGGNHPVKNLETGKIEITSQGHGFAVDADSLAGTGLCVTHKNVLDGTVEGVECAADKLFCVQHHPESAPGPQDSGYLFDKFIGMMKEKKRNA